ncbi:MAG: GNAT family N-acetyltransferase [Chryseobacterium sp.]|uniref:GNAT family N-acetyltransferase n=1 Tax=Chryseobacterium sp. TaxID=1871047 RepID=UPI0025B88F73|nr:GNAT family N-acetyltransferase [Chryseobacterium sp.]MCJ7935961.1 GNAT family N-acetyltransferase [Chryseobacterium sp.]
MQIINYTKDFKEKCLEIFKSNLPKFFAYEELHLFEQFLDEDIHENYYVVYHDNELIACGGIFLNEKTKEGGLAWGMVHSKYHRKGFGKLFTEYRINLLKKVYPGKIYRIETSQHTAPFYEKMGFITENIVINGFAKGIDKYIMKTESR